MSETRQPSPHSTHPSRFHLLSLLGATLIAAVLQFAAAAKVSSGADSLQLLEQTRITAQAGLEPDISENDMQWLIPPGGVVQHGILLDFALAFAEFSVVVLLLILHRGRLMWMVISIMFSGFFGYALLRTLNDDPCGCFGTLWHPPDWFSLTLDAGIILFALLILTVRRVTKPILGILTILAIASATAGYIYARSTAPMQLPQQIQRPDPTQPRPNGDPTAKPNADQQPKTTDTSLSASERLLSTSLMDGNRELTTSEPGLAVYLFVWSPECSTCQAMKPAIDALQGQYEAEQNPVLRIRSITKKSIAASTDITELDWESSPVVVIIQDAAIVATYSGEDSPLPNQVFDALMSNLPLQDLIP